MTLIQGAPISPPEPGGERTPFIRADEALRDALAAATGRKHRQDPVTSRLGGPAGNARLTAWLGLLLLVFFLAETTTLISVGQLMTVHILIGAFLVPVVVVKTGTTGWRMVRYYTGSSTYRLAGPPPLLLRLLGPLVVFTSMTVVGSGLALIALGHTTYATIFTVAGFRVSAITIHQASFLAWGVVIPLHLAGRLVVSLQTAGGRVRSQVVPGKAVRTAVLAATVVGGVAVALLVLHLSGSWTHHSGFGHVRTPIPVPR